MFLKLQLECAAVHRRLSGSEVKNVAFASFDSSLMGAIKLIDNKLSNEKLESAELLLQKPSEKDS